MHHKETEASFGNINDIAHKEIKFDQVVGAWETRLTLRQFVISCLLTCAIFLRLLSGLLQLIVVLAPLASIMWLVGSRFHVQAMLSTIRCNAPCRALYFVFIGHYTPRRCRSAC